MNDSSAILVRLADAGLTVPFEQDIRGIRVVDRDGEDVGEVSDLLVDEGERKVRFLEVASGGFLGLGEEKRLVPVDAITRIDDQVHVSTSRTLVADSPVYDPDVARAEPTDHLGSLYAYYGYGPYWGPDYVYPGMRW